MKSPRTLLLLAAALLAVALVAWLARRNQRVLAAGLPPRTVCASLADAFAQASAEAQTTGGGLYPVLGTGSMAPFIPSSAPGLDPRTAVVAYAVGVPGATFADLAPGRLCIYAAEWEPHPSVIHQAAGRDSAGWIMTGLHNPTYENRTRVTAQNFRAIVARVFVCPPPSAL